VRGKNQGFSLILCDYALLSKVTLLNKRILNVRCSEPVDEVLRVNLASKWHALDINEAAIEPARKLVGVIALIKPDESASTKST